MPVYTVLLIKHLSQSMAVCDIRGATCISDVVIQSLWSLPLDLCSDILPWRKDELQSLKVEKVAFILLEEGAKQSGKA